MDNHHVAGKANSPVTIWVPVNDHRANLSVAQHDWPVETLENPNGSPLLRGAACIRGATEMIIYLIKQLLIWIADMLEDLDSHLVAKLGHDWWRKTELEKYACTRTSNGPR